MAFCLSTTITAAPSDDTQSFFMDVIEKYGAEGDSVLPRVFITTGWASSDPFIARVERLVSKLGNARLCLAKVRATMLTPLFHAYSWRYSPACCCKVIGWVVAELGG